MHAIDNPGIKEFDMKLLNILSEKMGTWYQKIIGYSKSTIK